MPIIVKYQLGKPGTVIAVQIENELDFYDCKQVESYIARLRDDALAMGVQVPIVVCAGQCDVERAGGLVKGVLPTINLYPEPREKTLEDKINHYVEVFYEQNFPFCISDTSQAHFILRRELIAGAKFIAPYNQVSGTDFGFTTAVNNWGQPISYMTHDYDLKGMINPQGECLSEYEEAYLFSGLIQCFEAGLSGGRSGLEEELDITGDCQLSNGINRTLRLANGGKLAAIANIDDKVGSICFQYGGKSRPFYTKFKVQPLTCPIIPIDTPLLELGLSDEKGKLAYSTTELCSIHKNGNNLHLLFYTDDEAEIAFAFTDAVEIKTIHMGCHTEEGLNIFTFTGATTAVAEVNFQDGKTLYLYGVSRDKAIQHKRNNPFSLERSDDGKSEAFQELMFNQIMEHVKELVFDQKQNYILDQTPSQELDQMQNNDAVDNQELGVAFIDTLQKIKYHKHILGDMGKALSCQEEQSQKQCFAMEDMNYSLGYGWYEGNVVLASDQNNLGYMVYNGMDIIHLYRNNQYLHSFIGDCTHKFIKEPKTDSDTYIELGVRSEIWGHSNFSDLC